MKTCMQCGQSVQDVESYCPRCGSGQLSVSNIPKQNITSKRVNSLQGNQGTLSNAVSGLEGQSSIGSRPNNSRQPQQAPPGYRHPNAISKTVKINDDISNQNRGRAPTKKPPFRNQSDEAMDNIMDAYEADDKQEKRGKFGFIGGLGKQKQTNPSDIVGKEQTNPSDIVDKKRGKKFMGGLGRHKSDTDTSRQNPDTRNPDTSRQNPDTRNPDTSRQNPDNNKNLGRNNKKQIKNKLSKQEKNYNDVQNIYESGIEAQDNSISTTEYSGDVTEKEWFIMFIKLMIPFYNIYFIVKSWQGKSVKPSMQSYIKLYVVMLIAVIILVAGLNVIISTIVSNLFW